MTIKTSIEPGWVVHESKATYTSLNVMERGKLYSMPWLEIVEALKMDTPGFLDWIVNNIEALSTNVLNSRFYQYQYRTCSQERRLRDKSCWIGTRGIQTTTR